MRFSRLRYSWRCRPTWMTRLVICALMESIVCGDSFVSSRTTSSNTATSAAAAAASSVRRWLHNSQLRFDDRATVVALASDIVSRKVDTTCNEGCRIQQLTTVLFVSCFQNKSPCTSKIQRRRHSRVIEMMSLAKATPLGLRCAAYKSC